MSIKHKVKTVDVETVTARLPVRLIDQLRAKKGVTGISIQWQIRSALEKVVEQDQQRAQ